MTDDVGFGASSTFGGPIPTPTLDALAKEGLRYNQFHTTAMCSPTRAALLTGRNHHEVNTATVVDLATGEPGYTSIIPRSAATIGKVLEEAGYSTAWLGKNHNTPDWEITPQGPFDRWPTGYGFDYFYGYMGGAADQNHPPLVENTRLVEAPRTTGYNLDRDLTDHALSWLRVQHESTPDKPFFLYWAPGTAHSPHRAPKEWITRFKGKFDQGWDRVREETFARQKQEKIIPADALLTPRPPSLPSWESLKPEQRAIAARMMEVSAAQLSYFDDQLGRVIADLKRTGQYQNTVIIFIEGDNGASGEGTLYGSIGETLNPEPGDETAFNFEHLDQFGGPTTFENYPAGWGWAMDTPFQYTKQVASHLGGTRNGMVIVWPKGISDHGGLRTQFSHVIDIAPTIYELARIKPPTSVDGVSQMPLDGDSLVYTFNAPGAPSKHRTQYFEMLGNRGWYEDGWLASTTPGKLPWTSGPIPDPNSYAWELYDLRTDYSQGRDLAKTDPAKLEELKRHFAAFAQTHQVFPLQNQLVPRMNDDLRPYVTNGRTHFEFFPSETRLPNPAFPDVKNRSWTLRAHVIAPPGGGEGAIIDQGGWFGGWGLFLRSGHPTFVYKASIYPAQTGVVSTAAPLGPGEHDVNVAVAADGPQLGAGATVRILVDGAEAAVGHVPATVPLRFTDEGVGIGRKFGTGLTDLDAVPDRYTGAVEKVELDLAASTTPVAAK